MLLCFNYLLEICSTLVKKIIVWNLDYENLDYENLDYKDRKQERFCYPLVPTLEHRRSCLCRMNLRQGWKSKFPFLTRLRVTEPKQNWVLTWISLLWFFLAFFGARTRWQKQFWWQLDDALSVQRNTKHWVEEKTRIRFRVQKQNKN